MNKKMVPVAMLAALLLAGCMVGGRGPRGSGAVILAPALPTIVVLESEPYYQHGGYFYYYRGNSWSYSRSKSGPWVDLPRDRYPKEVKYKGKDDDRGRGHDRGRGDERGLGDERGKGEKRGHDKKD